MIHLLLKLFKTKDLASELAYRESILPENKNIWETWRQVFHRVPEVSQALRYREYLLLRSLTLHSKSNEFILGRIEENRLMRSYDSGNYRESEPKVVSQQESQDIISRLDFLAKWKNGQASDSEKESVSS